MIPPSRPAIKEITEETISPINEKPTLQKQNINKENLKEIVTIVIPTLNEAQAIGKVIQELKELGYKNILVVDGKSTDGTPEIAREMGAKVIFQEGKGKADAIRTAFKHINTEFMLVMDGDYTYPAKHIEQMLEMAINRELDEVIGVREFSENQSMRFKFGNKALTKFFNLLFGTGLKDVLSGMYLVRVDAIRDVAWETKGFSIESEIVAHVASQSGKVGEVPIEYRKRIGEKKLGVKHGFSIAKDIVRLAWHYNPTFFVFLLGSLLLIPGLILGAWVAYRYFIEGVKHHIKGLIAMTLTTTGLQSLMLAILALYMKRVEYRTNHKLRDVEKVLNKILETN